MVSVLFNIYNWKSCHANQLQMPLSRLANGYSYSASSRSNMTDFITLTTTDPDDTDFTYAFEYCGPYSCPLWMLDETCKCEN